MSEQLLYRCLAEPQPYTAARACTLGCYAARLTRGVMVLGSNYIDKTMTCQGHEMKAVQYASGINKTYQAVANAAVGDRQVA